MGYYESQLSFLSASFAVGADFALLMGGKLKFAEFTSGRYADVLSSIFLGYATLWYVQKQRAVKPALSGSVTLASSVTTAETDQSLDHVLEYALDQLLFEAEGTQHVCNQIHWTLSSHIL